MIYMELGDRGERKLVILEHGNLDHLREGGAVVAPNEAVCLTVTNDIVWLGQEIESAARAGVLNDELLNTLIRDSCKRPIVNDRPDHGVREVIRDGQLVSPPEAA